MRIFLAALAVLLAAAPAHADPAGQRLLDERHLSGVVIVADAHTGAVLLSAASGGHTLDEPVLPLSLMKLYLAADYLAHHRDWPAGIDSDTLVARGFDTPGRALALALRHERGSLGVRKDMAALGLPPCADAAATDCLALDLDAPDAEWADVFSLGEASVRETPMHLIAFLRDVARDDSAGARLLRAAMLGTVETPNGTAHGLAGSLGEGWRIGGKTGSGPASDPPLNGCFAGFVQYGIGKPRLLVFAYVYHGGFGGGAAGHLAADAARRVLDRAR